MNGINIIKRVLFIIPPFYRFLGSHNNWTSMGVALLAQILYDRGYEAKVYNCDYLDSKEYKDLSELYNNSKDKENIFEVNEIYDEIVDVIKEYDPDILAITMVTGTSYSGFHIAKMVKKELGVDVIAGGPFVTLNIEDIIDNPYIDRFILGEGENVIEEALFSHERVIHGRPVKDLDSLPFIDMDRMLQPLDAADFITIMTSRGCYNSCIFCSSPVLWNHSVRYRSAENVLEEIRWRKARYNVENIYFIDDSLMSDKSRSQKILSGLKDLNIKWWCESTFSDLNQEIIKVMKESGCIRIKLGLEIANEKLLKKIGKKVNLQEVEEICHKIKENNINFTLYLLLGIPGATELDYLETIRFTKKLDATYYSISIAVPYKGTPLYILYKDKVKDYGLNTLFHTNYELLKFWDIDEKILINYLDLNKKNHHRRLD